MVMSLYLHHLARKRSAAERIHLALTHRIGYSDPIVGDSICDHIPEEKHPPIDLCGNDLQLGDWVRVMAVPLSIRNMPENSKSAFSRAVGQTFQIAAFNEGGYLELEMWPKISLDTIWVEPCCVTRVRRYKRLSRAFQKKLQQRAAPPPPRYTLDFDITLKPGVEIEAFGHEVIGMGTGGGFAVWTQQRRIKGSVHTDKSQANAVSVLESARSFILKSGVVESAQVGEISESG